MPLSLLPVIIHLIKHRKVKEEPFPDITLVEKAQEHLRKKFLLKEILQLIMRVLIIALLILAIAGPYAGDGVKGELLLIIDNSPSMGIMTERGMLFDKAKDIAWMVVDALPPVSRVSVVGLCGGGLDDYTSDKVVIRRAIDGLSIGFKRHDIRLLDGGPDGNSDRKILLITDGYNIGNLEEMRDIAESADIIFLSSGENEGYITIRRSIIGEDNSGVILRIGGISNVEGYELEVVEGDRRNIIEISDEDIMRGSIMLTDGGGAGYAHLVGSKNTFGSYAFYGERSPLKVNISTEDIHLSNVITSALNALRSVYQVEVSDRKSAELTVAIADEGGSYKDNMDTVVLFNDISSSERMIEGIGNLVRRSYVGGGRIDPKFWKWSGGNVNCNLSDIRFTDLLAPVNEQGVAILVSEDGYPVLFRIMKGDRKLYICSIPLSGSYSNLVSGGGIVKIFAIILDDMLGGSELEVGEYLSNLEIYLSPFEDYDLLGLAPGLYRRPDGRMVGLNINEDEFTRIQIGEINKVIEGVDISTVKDLDRYLEGETEDYTNLRPSLLIAVVVLLLIDSIIYFPAFRRLGAGIS